jgi:hypothetical protein
MTLAGLLKAWRSQWVGEADVRAEAWALGARHRGEVVEGARCELRDRPMAPRRAVLLKAVIRKYAERT